MRVSPAVVADIEWATLALTGLIAVVSLVGALYCIPWSYSSRQRPTTRAFNYLWVTRALLQVIAACYALSLDLRLQVLWSAKSAIIPGGYNVDAMCRLYIGLSFGLLEPSFLLLVLFACSHMVSQHASEPGSSPNLFIFALTAGLTLPMCAVQVFAALFSRIMTQLKYNEDLMYKFFAASASAQDTMCPGEPENPNCAVCLFPEFSTLISAAFALMYLLALWAVLGRVAGAAINRMLSRRIRLLQVCITLFFCASITLRGVTVVNIDPFSLDFVALWLSNVVVCSSLILVVSVVLVWVPVYDGRLVGATLNDTHTMYPPVDGPTELMPLVYDVHHAGGGSSSKLNSFSYSHTGPPPSSDDDDEFYDEDDYEDDYGGSRGGLGVGGVGGGQGLGRRSRGSSSGGSGGGVAAAGGGAGLSLLGQRRQQQQSQQQQQQQQRLVPPPPPPIQQPSATSLVAAATRAPQSQSAAAAAAGVLRGSSSSGGGAAMN